MNKVLWAIRRLLHWGVLTTFCLVFGIFSAVVYYVFVLELFGECGWGVKVVLCIELVMLLWSYLVAVYTVPRRHTFNPSKEELYKHGGEELRKMFNEKNAVVEPSDVLQHCRLCDSYKPPRAHHCTQCGVCVSKMDHHCPWINNCVHATNHRAFTLFVFYVPIGCSHTAYLLFPFVTRILSAKLSHGIYHTIIGCWCFAMSLALVAAVGMLLKQQCDTIRSNTTQIEEYIIDKAESRRGRTHADPYPFHFPYDLGFRKNFDIVFGGYLKLLPVVLPYTVYWELDTPVATQFDLPMEQLSQKAEKTQVTKQYKADKKFNGNWYSWCLCCAPQCWFLGWRAVWSCPAPDEPRLSIVPGDVLVVSRFRKLWLYGRKQEVGGKYEPTGWFPVHCCTPITPPNPYPELKKLAGTYTIPSGDLVFLDTTRVRYLNYKEAYSLTKTDGRVTLLGVKLVKTSSSQIVWDNGDVWERKTQFE
eukprot:TRINITY_DN5757_c0_g1_i1.p1 TRINITY_DN5757_c0_g1~~TRINITY_DN5757_c0_g1_i1.p1  ORF type:complete len:473 (+),score=69.16 TRINITY_DN5757_c0_g1_i1:79-1497(+)